MGDRWAGCAGSHDGERTSLCSESFQIRKERVISVKVWYLCGVMGRVGKEKGDAGLLHQINLRLRSVARWMNEMGVIYAVTPPLKQSLNSTRNPLWWETLVGIGA
jgi:hypothetical protein